MLIKIGYDIAYTATMRTPMVVMLSVHPSRVADLIARECGIKYHPGHVWKLLRQLGWSCQRPVGRALERNPAAIRRWKQKRWPELKKTL